MAELDISARRVQKIVKVVTCEHRVTDPTRKWNHYHRRSNPDFCRLNASYIIGGKHYCGRHAGIVALELLLAATPDTEGQKRA